jgi:hypothetical protein
VKTRFIWAILTYVTAHIRYSISLFLMLTAFASLLYAQNGEDSQPVDPSAVDVMIFKPWSLDGAVDPEYEEIIFDIVVNEMRAAGFTVSEADSWKSYIERDGRSDVFESFPLDIARGEERDVSLSVYYRLEDVRIFLMVKAYDLRRDRIIAGNVQIARNGLAILNSMNNLMARVIPPIADAAEKIVYTRENPGAILGTTAASVTFYSPDEGMTLSMPGIGVIGQVENGVAELPYQPLALGEQLTVTKEKGGYYSEDESFVLRNVTNEVQLGPLYPQTRLATEIYWNYWYTMGGGIGLRWYAFPDMVYVRIQEYLFVNPPYADMPSGASTVLHHDVALEGGFYIFFPPESRFRLSYSAGFAGIITPLAGGVTAVDSYINLAGITAELNYPGFTLFSRMDLRYALPLFDVRFFEQGTGIGLQSTPWIFGGMIKW